ncbi:MAG: hypothetical protein ACFE75_02490 [Candidatus Hodarchaeota archaeon]
MNSITEEKKYQYIAIDDPELKKKIKKKAIDEGIWEKDLVKRALKKELEGDKNE